MNETRNNLSEISFLSRVAESESVDGFLNFTGEATFQEFVTSALNIK